MVEVDLKWVLSLDRSALDHSVYIEGFVNIQKHMLSVVLCSGLANTGKP